MIRAMLMSALLIGLRRAEIVALKWEDIDFEKMSVSVNKSAYKVRGMPQGLKSPKSSHGYRTVFFPERLSKAFAEWRDEQEKMKEEAGEMWKDSGFIFTTATGEMISIYTPTDVCSKFEEKHGLRHLKLHGLRHTCGSLLMAMGTDAETVRDILGHDSVRTTDIYLHPYEKNKKAAACMMDAVLGGAI
jgi:integrase